MKEFLLVLTQGKIRMEMPCSIGGSGELVTISFDTPSFFDHFTRIWPEGLSNEKATFSLIDKKQKVTLFRFDSLPRLENLEEQITTMSMVFSIVIVSIKSRVLSGEISLE
jgi:hypothetical protein